ncbi:hypothetical protein QCA50_002353 [Cerrena zonata]|uniref:Uncharacterized protein n=1 Tax=Cerrena zonata TaxID=2478898 RepID=A0AAW0GWR8_9APHY
MPTFTGEAPPGSTMGLSELKRVATEGINSLSLTATERPPDGEYRSLPLEGRVDLMRPKPEPEPESVPEQAGGQQDDNSRTPTMHTAQPVTPTRQTFMQTLPTPGPNEFPPTPYLRGLSLPPTPTVAPFYGHSGQAQTQQPSPHGGLGLVYQPSASGGSPSHGPSQSQAHQGWPSLQAPSSPTPAPSSVQQLSGSRTVHTHPHIQYIPPAQPQQQQHQQSQSQQPYHHHHHSHHVHRSQDTTQSHPHSSQSQLVHNFIRHSPLQTRPSSGQSSPSQAEGGGIPLHHWPGSPRGSPPHHRRSSKHGSPVQLRSGHSSPVHRFHGAPSQHVPQPQQVHQLQHVHQPQPRQPQNEPQPQSQQQPQSPPVQYYPREQLRSPSPPKVSWNPAFEPPPREPPPPSVFPTDTYFPNIWDQEPNQRHDATHQTFSPEPSTPNVNKPDVFFHPPPAPIIPEQLVREGQYANVLGLANSPETQGELTQVPTPDRNKVKSIFPWEEKPRHVPRRVFPASEAPPPTAKFIEEEKPKPSPKPAERPPLSVQTPLSPIGLPSSLTMTYTNAWDVDPSIQRYASKLVRPNSFTAQIHAPPAPMSRDHGWKMLNKQRERERQERQDASSMDGDDEDEGDDEESGVSDGESRKRRSRAGSTVTAAPSRGGKTYKMRGVQTETPQMKSKSVQVTVLRDDGGRARTDSGSSTKTYRNAGSGSGNFKREWSTSGLLPAPILHEGRLEYEGEPEQMSSTPNVSTSLRSVLPFPSLSTPTGLRSPQTLGSPRAYSPPKGGTPVASPSPPKPSSPTVVPTRPPTLRRGSTTSSSSKSGSPQLVHSPRSVPSPRRVSLSTPPQKPGSPITGTSASKIQTTPPQRGIPKLSSPFSPQLQRSVSMDTAATLSPATSASLITPENTPIIPARKGGRVFDPARGIDIFKRSSEEVLSRFLRMGSFEEEEARRREHV